MNQPGAGIIRAAITPPTKKNAPVRQFLQGADHRGSVYSQKFCQSPLRGQALFRGQKPRSQGPLHRLDNTAVQGQMFPVR